MERNIDDYTKKYLQHPFEDQSVKYRRKIVKSQIEKYPHRRILEIGCGMDPFFEHIKWDEYDIYTIVEPSESFCSNAVKLSKAKNSQITIINSIFESVADELKSNEYDFIICSSLLHELNDPVNLIESIKKCCRKSTVVHFNVPNSYSLHRLIAYEMGMIKSVDERSDSNIILQQRGAYSLEKLKNEMIDCGFCVIDEGSYFLKPFTHKQMQDMLDSKIIDVKVLDGLFNVTQYFPNNGSEIYVNVVLGNKNVYE